MELRERADRAVKEACDALGIQFSEDNQNMVSTIIEQAMRHAIEEATRHSTSAAAACCGADQDMAHKIAEEIKRTNTALIANLSAMR